MAHGQNASTNNVDRQWWGKRPLSGHNRSRKKSKTNKYFKRLLHKIERVEGKAMCEV